MWNAHEKSLNCTGYNKKSKTILMQYIDNEMIRFYLLAFNSWRA